MERPLYESMWQALSAEKAMVFAAGPRQAGKTTLAQRISRSYRNALYCSWDIPEHRVRLLENPVFFTELARHDASTPLIVFDEIHKYKDWKNYLKGAYDGHADGFRFLVTGSGRLDLYQKGGDSLAGRYALFHLWPFCLAELAGQNRPAPEFFADPLRVEASASSDLAELWDDLGRLSGFPEPFLSGWETTYRRWSNAYGRQLVREDIRDLAQVRSIGEAESLYYLLPSKVGSPLSYPSIAATLKVSYNSVRQWTDLFERFFLGFSVGPWTDRISRAIQKQRKFYLWDAPRIRDPRARFENRVALELYRATHAWTDWGLGDFALHFLRDKEGREVDFLIARDREPILLVEAKVEQREPSASLRRFQTMLDLPAVQLRDRGDTFRVFDNRGQKILVAPASLWLCGLP